MKKRWYAMIVLGLILIMQLFRIDKTNPPSDLSMDFILMTHPPEEIAEMIKISCYDCHSNKSIYPWYSNLAPVSWYIKSHINEARGRINFSSWADFPVKGAVRKLEASAEDIEEGVMPLSSYTLMHSNAKLSPVQSKKLADWFKAEAAKVENQNE